MKPTIIMVKKESNCPFFVHGIQMNYCWILSEPPELKECTLSYLSDNCPLLSKKIIVQLDKKKAKYVTPPREIKSDEILDEIGDSDVE